MRRHHHILQCLEGKARRLRLSHVPRRIDIPGVDHAIDPTAGQRREQGGFVDDRPASDIHDHRPLAHRGKRRFVDQAIGLFGERQGRHDDIGRSHEGREVRQGEGLIDPGLFGRRRTIADRHAHSESLRRPGDRLADVAEP